MREVSHFNFQSLLIDMASQTALYAQGAGLGASKPKDIGKLTEGYSGYVHMAQEAVSTSERR